MSRAWWMVLCLAGCAPEAAERATRDETVGVASTVHGDVVVTGGLAVVRSQTADTIQLWASAPAIELTVTRPVAREVAIEVLNAMPEAVLTGVRASSVASPRPTQKRWLAVLPEGTSRFTIAPPEATSAGAWRFGFLADVQDAIDRVQDVFATLNAQPELSFVLGAGDLTQDGTLEEMARFEAELVGLARPFYSTLGNHDVLEGTLWHDVFGRGSFRFTYRGVQFTLLDSASATLDPKTTSWLQGWLDEGRSRTHVVAMHIPLVDPVGVRNGAFGSRAEAAKILAMMAGGEVDLALYGHIHSFYAFDHAGIPAFIAGGGGAFPETLDGYERHVLVFDVGAEMGVIGTSYVPVDEE